MGDELTIAVIFGLPIILGFFLMANVPITMLNPSNLSTQADITNVSCASYIDKINQQQAQIDEMSKYKFQETSTQPTLYLILGLIISSGLWFVIMRLMQKRHYEEKRRELQRWLKEKNEMIDRR